MTDEEYLALQSEWMQLVKAETYNDRREELRLRLEERYTLWWESLTPEEQEDARAKAREAIRDYHRRRKAGAGMVSTKACSSGNTSSEVASPVPPAQT